MPRPARITATGLHAPVNAASADGSAKIPAPITELMTAAVRSRRPMTRSSWGELTEMLINQLNWRTDDATRLPLHRPQLHEQVAAHYLSRSPPPILLSRRRVGSRQ